jgi:hypothetical protein
VRKVMSIIKPIVMKKKLKLAKLEAVICLFVDTNLELLSFGKNTILAKIANASVRENGWYAVNIDGVNTLYVRSDCAEYVKSI